MKALGILLLAVALPAQAFPVCDPAPQYVRIELHERAFGPLECNVLGIRSGDPASYVLTALTLLSLAMPWACAGVYAPERGAMFIDVGQSADSVVGHELRHVFPPVHSHPAFLPFVDSSCSE